MEEPTLAMVTDETEFEPVSSKPGEIPKLDNAVGLHPDYGTWDNFLKVQTTLKEEKGGYKHYVSANAHYIVLPDGSVRTFLGYLGDVAFKEFTKEHPETIVGNNPGVYIVDGIEVTIAYVSPGTYEVSFLAPKGLSGETIDKIDNLIKEKTGVEMRSNPGSKWILRHNGDIVKGFATEQEIWDYFKSLGMDVDYALKYKGYWYSEVT